MIRSLLRITLVLAASLLFLPVLANIKKAFEALEVHNYFLAKDLFQKNTKRNPEAAWYGLSVISGRDNNPFYDLDSAYVFIMRSDAAFTLADDNRRRSLAKLGVDHTAIEAQKEHVFERAWDIAQGRNTIDAYDRYLRTFRDSHRSGEAIQLRDQLAFQEARDANTSEAFQAFIGKYPHAREVYEARSRLQEAIYRESTREGDLASYVQFLERYPDSPYATNAEDEIYNLSSGGRTAGEYHSFITTYPSNHRVPDAWRSIYEIYTRDLSVDAITRFLTEYPDYPFVEELVDDYNTASLVLLPFRREGHWGFIDDEGNERIKAEYEWVEPFEGAQALVGTKGKVGTINRSGSEVIPIEYEEVLDPVEGISLVALDGKLGAVDRNGNMVVPMEYSDLGDFHQKLAYASKDSVHYGFVNVRGEEVIPFTYNSAGSFRNALAVIETDEGFGVIDSKGDVIIAPDHEWVEGFEREVSRVRRDGLMGLLSPFGDELLAVRYNYVGPFKDGLALVVDGKKCGYVDMSGHIVIPFEYEAAESVINWGDMHGGLAEVQQSGKRCLINAANQKVMPCQFADIGPATGALIPFRKRTKWGYADRKGTVLFDNRYEQAWEMIDGLARVKNSELFGAIDSTGREVIPLRFLSVSDPQFGHVVVAGNEGAGLMTVHGHEVIPLIYDAVTLENGDIARVERNKKFAYIRIGDGRFIWKEEGFEDPAE